MLPLLFALVAAQLAAAPVLTVGARDGRLLSGVHDVERIGGRSVRWTTGAGVLTLPRTAAGAPLLLDLGLLNARPADQPDPQVQLAAGGAVPVRFGLPRSLNGEGRRYRLLLPPSARAQARVEIASDTILLAADPRRLGVLITGASLAPIGAGLRLPPPLNVAALALIALCVALALRGVGTGARAALAVSALAAAGLAWGGAARPAEVLPFLPRLAALGLLACGTLALARLLSDGRWQIADSRLAHSAATISAPSGTPPTADNQQSTIGNLPIFMGLAWWAMPAFQLIMLADGARPAIAPQTLYIGFFVAVGLVALAAWRLLTGRSVVQYAVALLLAADIRLTADDLRHGRVRQVMAALVRSHSSIVNRRSALSFSLFIILMIVAVPAAWMHYEAALILPFALLLIYAGDALSPGQVAAVALAYALISYGNQWSFFNGEVLGGLSVLGYSYKFYGMLLLFGASVSALLAMPRAVAARPAMEQATFEPQRRTGTEAV